MATIYVLTAGEYSDFHIVALYSTRELAEQAKNFCPDSEIHEYELDGFQIPDHPPGCTAWRVDVQFSNSTIWFAGKEDSLFDSFTPREESLDWLGIYRVWCWARDQDHAKKIALDKFYQFKAQQMGL